MSEPLFSSFVLVDPNRAWGSTVAAASREPAGQISDVVQNDADRLASASQALVDAIRELTEQTSAPDHLLTLQSMMKSDFSDLRAPSLVLELGPSASVERWTQAVAFIEKVLRATANLSAKRQEVAIAKLADVLLPDALAPARGVLASDELEIRDRFLATYPSWSSQQIHEMSGLGGSNRYATANRWKKSGDIFAVKHRDAEHFPQFQFRDGRPHPAVKAVLEALPEQMSAWQRAFWFVSTNGWLDDDAPVDRLDDRDALVAATAHEFEDVVG
jgi:hypothetical protein